jgi:hypothetical protein
MATKSDEDVRVSVKLRPIGRTHLSSAQTDLQLNTTETVHKALALLAFVAQERAQGREFYSAGKNASNPVRVAVL